MTDRPTIWVVEDDAACLEIVLDTLGDSFRLRAFRAIRDLEASAAAVRAEDVRLVIADVYLADSSFVAWAQRGGARRLFPGIPFLIMSSVDDVALVRSAFGAGAVDFLAKPFGRAQLRVKVERAVGGGFAEGSAAAGLELDAVAMTASKGGSSVVLTAKEMQILTLLAHAPSGSVTRADLTAAVWRGLHVGPKTLDVHLSRLRRKLAPLGMDVRPNAGGALAVAPLEPPPAGD